MDALVVTYDTLLLPLLPQQLINAYDSSPDHLMLINPGSSLTLILRRCSEPLDVDSGRCSVPLIQLDSFWRGIY